MAELRKIRPGIKVILTSAYGRDTALPVAGGQQPWRFVQKPFQISALADLLRNACALDRRL
jgi:DNA-binding NtrC family response regulator